MNFEIAKNSIDYILTADIFYANHVDGRRYDFRTRN